MDFHKAQSRLRIPLRNCSVISLFALSLVIPARLSVMLSWSARSFSRYRAQRAGHVIDNLCPDTEAVSLDDPARFII
jgi:hypothetical protein